MKNIPRDVAQTMLTKLDLGLIKPIEIKRWASGTYGVQLAGRTREQVAKSISAALKPDSEE